jgi:hypothetical protein
MSAICFFLSTAMIACYSLLSSGLIVRPFFNTHTAINLCDELTSRQCILNRDRDMKYFVFTSKVAF